MKINSVSFEELDNEEYVYDIEVPGYHNFLLDNGVFVHNCGWHNLPAGEMIKGILTSRFHNERGETIGSIIMPDGSQMEIRSLMAASGDENLLHAFEEGLDIHRFFASKIYHVPYDDVAKWMRGLAKNAVFGIVYGESIKSFADRYMKGSTEEAQKVFDAMFEGFPKIKEFIDRAHSQFEKFGKVTTFTQRYININDPRADHNRLLRQSQNYSIQGGSEDLAGIIMYRLAKFIEDNNMKSKIFCFIHDSIECDICPNELLKLIDKVNYLFNVFPREEFGVPVACDVPVGPSMGQEIETEIVEMDEDYNEATLELKGYVDDIEEMLEIWSRAYKEVDILENNKDEYKKVYVERSKMFLPVKASISDKAGTYRDEGKMKVHIKIK